MAKFMARCENQVLVMRGDKNQVFDGIVQLVPGIRIRFERGEFETEDATQIEFLRNHRFFGNQIFENSAKK